MQKLVKPSVINGTIQAPASKSMTQRAIAAGLLAEGHTIIRNPSYCNDSLAAIRIARELGANIEKKPTEILIQGSTELVGHILNCGEAGLSVRMFSPIAALHAVELTMQGEGSLLQRPLQMIEDALTQLGASCTSNNGFLPLTIKGPIKGGHISIDGSMSSQLLTGLLMALPLAKEDSQIDVKNLKSKPYVDMTLQLLTEFGVDVEHINYETFSIQGKQHYKAHEYSVEGDWSGGAFLLIAGAIAGHVTVKGLHKDSSQADVAILDALYKAGAEMEIGQNVIIVNKSTLVAFDFDATECPDLFPPLAALAAYCKGTTTIKGVGRLTHKESNRAMAIQQEFAKMGIAIQLKEDTMYITGGTVLSTTVDSHNDHRMAMAEAIAALGAQGPITITNPSCVAKSYPEFFDDLKQIGGITL